MNRFGPDVVEWLLEEENPSARCLAWRWLLGQPNDDPQVAAARAAIPGWGPARAILDAQWPAGYWVAPGAGYSPRHKATVWQILFLAALDAPLIPPIERACDHVLAHGRLPDGRFRAGRTARGGTMACLNGSLLWAMFRLGYHDPRIADSLEALAEMVRRDGFRCRFNAPHPLTTRMDAGLPCASGAVKVLGACVEAPAAWRSPAVRDAASAAVTLLVSRPKAGGQPLLTSGGEVSFCPGGARWHQFGFPPDDSADLLEALDVLGRAGAPPPPGLQEALAQVHAKRRTGGTWLLEHAPDNTWASFGKPGQPNKWVTIRAMAVIQRWEEET